MTKQDRELLQDIKELVAKLVSRADKTSEKKLKTLEDRISSLEAQMSVLQCLYNQTITRPTIFRSIPDTGDPIYPNYPPIYCGKTDDKEMFKQYEAHQKAIDSILEGSSIDDPKIK